LKVQNPNLKVKIGIATTVEKFPIEYARTQFNMGTVYYIIAEVEDKAKNYNLAIMAFRESLKIFTKKDFQRYVVT